ncbi:hypothetical protein TNCV_179731 [Trichonephila clavipes]|nr:hypothetical protein TNCV_179731 [Trichonephila clavipes]
MATIFFLKIPVRLENVAYTDESLSSTNDFLSTASVASPQWGLDRNSLEAFLVAPKHSKSSDPLVTATKVAESVPDEIGNLIDEVINLACQINVEVNSDDVQDLLDSHNKELTMDELVEMHEQKQDIEELKSSDPKLYKIRTPTKSVLFQQNKE